MRRSTSYTLIPTPEQLAKRFLAEVLAVSAGVQVGNLSIHELGQLCGETRYCDAEDNLAVFFTSLKRYRRRGDFKGLATLPRPRPLQLHIDPYILYGHFRAWLRKQKVDPDQVGEPGELKL
jgi:hypothetical protein